jgi:hypothetical protein
MSSVLDLKKCLIEVKIIRAHYRQFTLQKLREVQQACGGHPADEG